MEENIQDKIISFEDCKEYNISYPVIIKRWEIRQVNGLNKLYLQVYFQKIASDVKAFKFNVKCYSNFGEIEEIPDILLQEADKLDIEFSKAVPIKSETTNVEINICQCLLLDNTYVEPKGKQIVVDTFKPFNDEDLEAAQRLLPTAKGLPIDNVSHWYCACGTPYRAETQKCLNCNKSKTEIFINIKQDNVQEEKSKLVEIYRKKNDKEKIKKIILSSIALGAVLFTLISLAFYTNLSNCKELGPVSSDIDMHFIFAGFYVILIFALSFLILNVINFFLFKDKTFKNIELVIVISCVILNAINSLINYMYDFYSYVFFIPLLINLLITIAYFVCNKIIKIN